MASSHRLGDHRQSDVVVFTERAGDSAEHWRYHHRKDAGLRRGGRAVDDSYDVFTVGVHHAVLSVTGWLYIARVDGLASRFQ